MEENSRVKTKGPQMSVKYDQGFYLVMRLYKEYIKPQRNKMFVAILCMFLVGICTGLNALIMQPVLDKIFFRHDSRMLYFIPMAIVAIMGIKCLAMFTQASTMKMVGQKIVSEIQLSLYEHLIKSDMRVLMDYPSGNLISRFTNDINTMKKGISDVFTGMFMEFCTLLGLISVMFYQASSMAIISVFLLPFASLPIVQLGKKMRKIARGMQEELGDFTVRLDETFQNARVIKSYCREDYEISRTKIMISRFLELYKKAACIESLSSPIMEFLGGVVIAVIILYGGTEVIAGHTTPGSFFSFIFALLMSYKPLKTISNLNTSLQEAMVAARRLFMLIDEEIKIKDDPNVKDVSLNSYKIEFSDVYFSYKPDQMILDGLNITIQSGHTIALVGTSGSGKTTVLNLMERLYDPNYGKIMIDGKDIRTLRLKTLRNSIAMVSQEIALFDDTIKENIRYGRLDATDEEVVKAAMAAAAHDFIVGLADGYDTQIGQHGMKLSGGQRQRIAIARAILKNAPILLLDEATSALDAVSEKQIQSAMEYLKKGRTTIVIAHRLSTIESADVIYVISDGRVIESGKHADLIASCGEYSRLQEQYINSKLQA